MDNTLLCLMVSWTLWSCAMTSSLPRPDFPEHVKRLIMSDDVDGYEVATVHALEDGVEVGQTKRDLELHAADSTSTKKHFILRMADSGEELRMSLNRRRHVDTSGTQFYEITEKGKREIAGLQVRNCFFDGPLSNGQGHAHLSMCGGRLQGTIRDISGRRYNMIPLLETTSKRSTEDGVMRVLLTWKDRGHDALQGDLESLVRRHENDGIEIPKDEDDVKDDDKREQVPTALKVRRGTAVQIEIGSYLDKFYIAACASELGLTSDQELIDLVIHKFSSAASVLWSAEISWDITLKLSDVTLMKSNPTWYNVVSDDPLGDRLDRICEGTVNESYDQVTLLTSLISDTSPVGLGWMSSVCIAERRCSVSRDVNTDFHTELHELGHNLGLHHDEVMEECNDDTEELGFMSDNKDVFRSCYQYRLDDTFSSSEHNCVFTDNVSGNYGVWDGK